MIARAIFYFAGTVAVAAVGYGVLTQAAPAAAGKIDALAHDYLLGWPTEACEANPLGCLNNRFNTLRTLESQVDKSVTAVRSQLNRIEAMVTEQDELVARNAALLTEGKTIFKQRSQTSTGPVVYAGREYPTVDAFKQQLQLLFQEKPGLEANLGNAKALQGKLKARLDDLMVQAGDITLAKRMIPAQIELVRANTVLADFGSNIEMINGVIKGSEAGVAETEQLILTTKDLMAPGETATGAPKATNKDFEEFLAK